MICQKIAALIAGSGDIMESYIYIVRDTPKKGKKEICVYSVIDNRPEMIGSKIISTASYPGDRATARQVISEVKGYKMLDMYTIDKEINLYSV